ncbi:hypothetical protein MLD38_003490 [Melastoma candidum]|uniref:Uncharacterized protein n=1 Tax=Melastoma candidum TaxID=119954 RepID=A0ACB9S2E8_9MYRT|nr:hypothetical protein MLD38_003490 [Melastoma candidum]
MDRTGTDPLSEILGFPEFINESRLDEIIDLIQEECTRPDVFLDYGLGDSPFGGDLLDPVFGDVLGCDQDSVFDPFIGFGEDVKANGDEDNDGEISSATTPTTSKKMKRDRSRTLVSERRRRCRMKEKLYALRSLVPNITKMDKASIVGDAVFYVEELQFQVRRLKDDIERLESTFRGAKCSSSSVIQGKPKRVRVPDIDRTLSSKLSQIDVLEVCKRTYNVRVVCETGDRVTASLYRALESVKGFEMHTSNLALVSDRCILFTFNLKVNEGEPDSDVPSLRSRVCGALLSQGFELQLPPAS